MSNNKQSMKLYTEEQVKSMLVRAKIFKGTIGENFIFIYSEEGCLESQTPIELPTDEEIEKESPYSNLGWGYEFGMNAGFKKGAKWMRDKIQGGNK